MKGFKSNIEKDTLKNENFRKVLYTSNHLQLVLMTLKTGEEIGEEVHIGIDQFFRFESGKGRCITRTALSIQQKMMLKNTMLNLMEKQLSNSQVNQ